MALQILFSHFAKWTARMVGDPRTFAAALFVIAVWLLSGPLFGFSDRWQLLINSFTTIVTFMMVFLIQNTQYRDAAAMQVKLDEVIRATEGAHNALLDLEEMTDEELKRIRQHYGVLASTARQELASGQLDTDRPEVDLTGEMSDAELTAQAERIIVQSAGDAISSPAIAVRDFSSRHSRGRIAPSDPSVRALKQLIAGNRRYCSGKPRRPHQDVARRSDISNEQQPFAVVLGCSDSRVPPEIVFDQGLGDLFTIRVAGHILDESVLGSIEFAVADMNLPLVVVLGHEQCAAVLATISALASGKPAPGHLNHVVQAIAPVVERATEELGDPIRATIQANTYLTVDQLRSSDVLEPLVQSGRVRVVGAYYDLDSGRVEFLPE